MEKDETGIKQSIEERKIHAAQTLAKYHRWDRFPSFRYIGNALTLEDTKMLGKVKGFLNLLDFNSPALGLTDRDKRFLKDMKKHGLTFACNFHSIKEAERLRYISAICSKIGQALYDTLAGDGFFKAHRRIYNIVVFPAEYGDFAVLMRKLSSIKTTKGGCYHYRLKPKVLMNHGKSYSLTFSNHTIDRLYERFAGSSGNYMASCAVFELLADARRFDTFLTTYRGKPQYFARVYAPITNDFTAVSCSMVMDDYDASAKYLILAGYYPLVTAYDSRNNSYACADTLITPGMNGTPEYVYLMEKADIDWQERKKVLDSFNNSKTFDDVLKHRDFYAFEWFHEHVEARFVKDDGSYFQPCV